MKLFISLLTVILFLATPATSMAHSGLAHAEPGAGAYLEDAPSTLALHFTAEVRLINLVVKDEAGKPVTLETSRVMTPQQGFSLPLPTLTSGTYTVEWTIMGGDSHKMSGSYQFTIM